MRRSREEEQKLGRQALAGDPAALDELIQSNLWIVPRIVGSMNVPFKLREDARQEGYLGLIEAARRFNPRAGARLSTYATYWVKMRVRDFVDRWRRRWKTIPKSLDDSCGLIEEDVSGLPSQPLCSIIESDREQSPDATAEQKELMERLKAAESMLPAPLRMILRRRFWTKRSVAGQAAAVEMTEEKLRHVLALTLRFLRNQVDEQ